MTKEPIECVYFIHAEGTDLVKVGYTSDLARRFDQLQTACPHRLELLGIEQGPRSREKYYHDCLKPYRYRGEWFRLTYVVRDWIIAGTSDHDSDIEAHQRFRHSQIRSDDDSEEYRIWLKMIQVTTGKLLPPAEQKPSCEAEEAVEAAQ